MPLRFFNTYSRALEEFRPLDEANRHVKMYTCGPTVYSFAHIGNFRAYLFEDLLQRHLELRGYKVHRVMNLTDVDDKTIRGSREAQMPLQKFTQQFKDAFFADIDTLRIKRADEYPAATDQRYVDAMIRMIEQLIARVAPSEANVLFTGESGVGKEVFAAELHRLSNRAAGPMVKLNCSSFPANMIEAEIDRYAALPVASASLIFAQLGGRFFRISIFLKTGLVRAPCACTHAAIALSSAVVRLDFRSSRFGGGSV